ncbi:T9SS type A sorting domain-containing protein [Marnyiella aurantia]|uniref:T9SS type A sorting domain-containing protein n=1 Tax=Marnyiella aurantia TaxID=2758037 RepID=A0A7D7LMF0_9FLAO|nr:T9SS type A sorting domain-containing protein [Marnyiella aurantia]MBA5246268.1 T9SS type A sorting domain-containing protein [Marnyiella aurantia]QMS98359.1 T9SS type A sorting domain-containing protein [Marnyiella aurantia]
MKNKLYLLLCTTLLTFSYAQTYQWQWAKAGGGDTGSSAIIFAETRDEMIRDVVVDNNNNSYYLTTIYPQNPNINGSTITSYHSKDLLLFSLDCQGNLRWSQTIGGYNDSEHAWNLEVDNNGGLYMMAHVTNQAHITAPTILPVRWDPNHARPLSSVDYSDTTTPDPGLNKIFLLRYNTADGTLDWEKPLQNPLGVSRSTDRGDNGVWTMDNSYNIHAILGFEAGTHLGGLITVPSSFTTTYQYYLVKFNYSIGTGNVVNMIPQPNPLLLPITGNLESGVAGGKVQFLYDETLNRYYLAGSTSVSFQDYLPLDYNGTPLSNDGYVLAIDGTTGDVFWRREFTTFIGGTANQSPDEKIYSLIKDSDGSLYLSGRYTNGDPAPTLSGPGYSYTLPTNPPGALTNINFVMKLNPLGAVQWVKAPTSSNTNFFGTRSMRARIALNGNEIAFVKGTRSIETWDSFTVTNPVNDQANSLLVRLNKDTGNALGLNPILSGYGTDDELTSVAVDNDGNYVVGGYFKTDIFTDPNDNIPTISYGSSTRSQFYVAKLAKSACSAMATTETELDSHISFYPNPTQDEVQVSTKDTPKSWEIYGMTGQIVSKGAFSRGSNRINMSQLATGTYMVKVETEKGTLTGKVIKK